jgi:hypothetical protein
MRVIRLEISGSFQDEVVVDLDGRPSLSARIGFQEVTRELSAAEAEDLVARLDALPRSGLPLGKLMGLDGVIYRLKVSSGSGEIEYAWWCDVPKGWAPAERMVRRLVALTGFKASSYQR